MQPSNPFSPSFSWQRLRGPAGRRCDGVVSASPLCVLTPLLKLPLPLQDGRRREERRGPQCFLQCTAAGWLWGNLFDHVNLSAVEDSQWHPMILNLNCPTLPGPLSSLTSSATTPAPHCSSAPALLASWLSLKDARNPPARAFAMAIPSAWYTLPTDNCTDDSFTNELYVKLHSLTTFNPELYFSP